MKQMLTEKQAGIISFFSNVFAWYGFTIFVFLATILGKNFFPYNTQQTALIRVLLIFTISYFVRPLGSIIFGYLGDKLGATRSFRISLLMMFIPTVIIGVLPTYDSMGLSAVVLLISMRIIQGVAAGGELPSSVCYVYEKSRNNDKGVFLCSLANSGSILGVFCALLITSFLYSIFSVQEVVSWAWRIPFLIGLVFIVFTLYYTYLLKEDDRSNQIAKGMTKKRIIGFENYFKPIIKIICLGVFLSTALYVLFIWMPIYLHEHLNLTIKQSNLTTLIGFLVLVIFTIIFGYIADYFNKKWFLIISILTITLLSYPLFLLLQTDDLVIITFVLMLFGIALGLSEAVIMWIIGTLFTDELRCSGVSIGITFAVSIFGGGVPTLCSYLIGKTEIVLIPVFFLIGTGIIALPVACSIRNFGIKFE